jgi:spore maturation protein SpmA
MKPLHVAVRGLWGLGFRLTSMDTAAMLNYIWFGFFAISFLSASVLFIFHGQSAIFGDMITALFASAKQSVEIIIGLIGMMCFWLGMFEIAKNAKIVDKLAIFLAPLFQRIMPDVPKHHPAHASMTMNIAANMLGLDNAATPMGLQAMKDLQTLNPSKTIASNAQILFMVINSSAVTLIPISILMYRSQMGSDNPALVFIPLLLATSASTCVGFFSVAIMQKIKIFQPVVLMYLLGFALFISSIIFYFTQLAQSDLINQSQLISNIALISIVMLFLGVGIIKKVDVYSSFIKGAKQGVKISIKILPYLVAMLCAIALLRSSEALNFFSNGIASIVRFFGFDDAFVPALNTALMRPLSGSASRAMMLETMQHYGVDSFPALVSAVIQGSTETTFYVLALYFGCVGITHGRHALGCALLADIAGIVAAILLCYWFFV